MRFISRRQFFIGVASLVGVGVAGRFYGQKGLEAAPPLRSASNPSALFFELSSILTGLAAPNPALGKRIYQQIAIGFPSHEAWYSAVITHLKQGNPPTDLPEKYASLYRALLSAWYLGVVKFPEKTICIAFEDIVSYQLVRPALLPPSYAPGQPGFWVNPPVQGGEHV